MAVSGLVWAITLIVLVGVVVTDLAIVGRRPHEPSVRESTIWVSVYVAMALVFGAGIWAVRGGTFGAQFYVGWLTEYSLSVDNLFVFVIIMSRFAVPRQYQQKVLLIGIVLALVMRGGFIAAGAAIISQFVWIFYIFGAFLVYTAIRFARQGETDVTDYRENAAIRFSRRVLPVSASIDHAHLTTRDEHGKRLFTPLVIVMIALGTTDLVFALDSIPAIFGLTKDPYIVFTANVFALMGLRQLYFLLGGLLDRLKYLSIGLAIVLGFIGVKLILQALHENNVPFIHGGEPIEAVPEIPIWLSLAVIVVTLSVTTVLSLLSSRKDRLADRAAAAARDDEERRGQQNHGQDHRGLDRHPRPGADRSGTDRSGQDRASQDRASQDRASQDRGSDRSGAQRRTRPARPRPGSH
jgi:tellurite resistance protein TerC